MNIFSVKSRVNYVIKQQYIVSVLFECEVRSYVGSSLPCEGPAAPSCTAVSSSLAPSAVSLLLLSIHRPDAECGHLGPTRGTKSMQNILFICLFVYYLVIYFFIFCLIPVSL